MKVSTRKTSQFMQIEIVIVKCGLIERFHGYKNYFSIVAGSCEKMFICIKVMYFFPYCTTHTLSSYSFKDLISDLRCALATQQRSHFC